MEMRLIIAIIIAILGVFVWRNRNDAFADFHDVDEHESGFDHTGESQ